ncbi:MAG: hypothetical protein ABR517_03790 [Thermoanaerobaculia bacterium]
MAQRAAFIAILIALLTSSIHAAVVYDFRQTARSDAQGGEQTETSGKGVIEGDRSRVDFTAGTAFPIGSYIISRKGADQILMIDPKRSVYGEIDLSTMASMLASGSIEVSGVKTNVTQLPDHPTISGFPTDHYRIETSYRITLKSGPLPLTQDVNTVIEKWTTNAFGDVAGGFLDRSVLRTGEPNIDKILEAEFSKVKGLPLRQISTVNTVGVGSLARSSDQIGYAPRRTSVNEILLSNIRVESVPSSLFEIPAGYRRADDKESKSDENRMTVLSMEEPGTK